ncbi:Fur family transcriptional regulator [Sulfurospirillum arcachonense]|uniref:Fur family transcriptional regulator n=1 Tax=Sulfurospirillum arcachonense TaxID=57666 RepID=UPI00046AFCDF|nr:transcriptional repressor [Sulfurospirillum arcachonense]
MSHVELLKQYELKATPQRLCVLGVLEKYGHATLDDIEKYTKVKFPTLSLSTIYRNLNEMLKKDLLSEVKLVNKKDYFEIKKEKHSHLICKECGKIEDYTIQTDELVEQIETLTSNKILSATVSFDIICKECLSTK